MEVCVGAIVDGKVTGITTFGAFVALSGGRAGMVHISEVSHSYVENIRDYLAEGQAVRVKIIGIDQSNRINLSLKKAMEAPARPAPAVKPILATSGRTGAASGQPVEKSVSFEDRLKRFMQDSDSKMSDLNRNIDKKGGSNRRSRKG